MSKHTPGPWVFEQSRDHAGNRNISASNGDFVAQALDFNSYARDVEVDANARLVAAAPEMHEMLDTVSRWQPLRDDPTLGDFASKLRTLLAKVDGE